MKYLHCSVNIKIYCAAHTAMVGYYCVRTKRMWRVRWVNNECLAWGQLCSGGGLDYSLLFSTVTPTGQRAAEISSPVKSLQRFDYRVIFPIISKCIRFIYKYKHEKNHVMTRWALCKISISEELRFLPRVDSVQAPTIHSCTSHTDPNPLFTTSLLLAEYIRTALIFFFFLLFFIQLRERKKITIFSSQQPWLGLLTTTRGCRSTYVSLFHKSLAMWVIWSEFWRRFWHPTHSHCENSRYRGNRRSTMRARWERQTNRDAPRRKAEAIRTGQYDHRRGSVGLLTRPSCQVPIWGIYRRSAALGSQSTAFQVVVQQAWDGDTQGPPEKPQKDTDGKTGSECETCCC